MGEISWFGFFVGGHKANVWKGLHEKAYANYLKEATRQVWGRVKEAKGRQESPDEGHYDRRVARASERIKRQETSEKGEEKEMIIMPVPCACGKRASYTATVRIHDHLKIHIFACVCGAEYERKEYKNHPTTCPHEFEVCNYDFKDDNHKWETWWWLHCDLCGSFAKGPRMDTDAQGLHKAWDMEDPRVLKLLRLTKDTARFHFPKDVVKEFYTE